MNPNNYVKYKGDLLMRGSQAFKLWEEAQKDASKYKVLDAHMKALDLAARALIEGRKNG